MEPGNWSSRPGAAWRTSDRWSGNPAAATRHQLLLDDRIPYTSHNSSACLAWRSTDGRPDSVLTDVIEVAGQFLERVCPEAADPGLAVAIPSHIEPSAPLVADFSRQAKSKVLQPSQAWQLADAIGLHLSGHGGTQGRVVGALAAVALHLSGNDGLFINLPGLRRWRQSARARRKAVSVACGPMGACCRGSRWCRRHHRCGRRCSSARGCLRRRAIAMPGDAPSPRCAPGTSTASSAG